MPALSPVRIFILFECIGNEKLIDLRDKDLIGVMAYAFEKLRQLAG
ncbi:MAG: hypothetical protein WCK51_05815 [Armatimonadota bacterium]